MDDLQQAKLFLGRAKGASDAVEREAHVATAIAHVEKAIAAIGSDDVELTWQEREMLVTLGRLGCRPGQVRAVGHVLKGAPGSVSAPVGVTFRSLKDKGLVTLDNAGSNFALTVKGYGKVPS